MRVEIASVYGDVLQTKKPSVRVAEAVPAGVTPLSWHIVIPAAAEALTPEEFRVQFGDHAGEELALVGLSHGCTTFGPLRVQDREAVQVRGQAGRGIPRKRERAFVVHALGWGNKKAPDYVHSPAWPHAMGADVPETSKLSKGDAQ